MQITNSVFPNTLPSQMFPSSTQQTTKGVSIVTSKPQVNALHYHGAYQKSEQKMIMGYKIGELTANALQTGVGLVRSTARFAFNQVMNSSHIGAAAPGFKEAMLGLAILYNQQQPTQALQCPAGQTACDNDEACIFDHLFCNGNKECEDGSDESSESCNDEEIDYDFDYETTEAGPITTPSGTELEATNEPSPFAWLALPAILTAGAATAYGFCTFKSYESLRQANPDSPTIPLLLDALKHPLQFWQRDHQTVATAELPESSVGNRGAEQLELQSI